MWGSWGSARPSGWATFVWGVAVTCPGDKIPQSHTGWRGLLVARAASPQFTFVTSLLGSRVAPLAHLNCPAAPGAPAWLPCLSLQDAPTQPA